MSELILSSMSELFNYMSVKKLVVFRYLSETGNGAFGDYAASAALSTADCEKFEMSVKSVSTRDATEYEAKSYVMSDANSDCVYSVGFFTIPDAFQYMIKTVNQEQVLVIFQKYMV